MESKPSGWHDLVWRRPLTEAERAALAKERNLDLDLELEAQLTESLTRLPNAAVPTNFTARVMAAVDRDERSEAPRRVSLWRWRGFLPRLIAAAAIVVFTGTIWERYELNEQRVSLAKNVAQIAYSKQVPSLDALCNFEAIRRMSQPVSADKELLALMQ